MCGTNLKSLVVGLLLLLLSSFCYSEGKIYLTETEFNQIQEALTLSETELNLSKMELQKAQTLLTEAQNISSKVLGTQETLLKQFNEREKYWMERDKEQRDEIAYQGLIIKVGAIGIGIGGAIAFIASLVK